VCNAAEECKASKAHRDLWDLLQAFDFAHVVIAKPLRTFARHALGGQSEPFHIVLK
jgi:hypothetical protein